MIADSNSSISLLDEVLKFIERAYFVNKTETRQFATNKKKQ
jgi:hypothetical protein